MLFNRLNVIVGETKPSDEQRWQRMLIGAIDPYLKTPRNVTRLANTLQVIWPNVKGDVDLADLIAITTLQLFDPDVYTLIRDEIEVITHADYRFEDDKKFGERMAPNQARQPDAAKEAMTLMFPRLAKSWQVFSSDATNYILQKEQRRICTKEYHRNYFVFGRDHRMLSRHEIESIVSSPDPAPVFSAILERLRDELTDKKPSRIAALLEQICEAVYAHQSLTPKLLVTLLDNSNELIKLEDMVWEVFVSNNYLRLRKIIEFGLQRLDALKRREILEVLVKYEPGLQLRASIIQTDAFRHGHFDGTKKHESEQLFPSENIKDAALSVRDEIATVCEKNAIWDQPNPIQLIRIWWNMEGGKRFEDWVKIVIADDNTLIRFANELPVRTFQTDSHHGTNIVWTFNRTEWSKILNMDEIFERLLSIANNREDALYAFQRLKRAESDKEI